jgi:hypothetical protein
MQINATRDWPTVAENLVEAAARPDLYMANPPYTPFPESAYTGDRIFKGRTTFDRKSSKSKMPFMAFFYNKPEEYEMNVTQTLEAAVQVMVLFAHQNPKLDLAMKAACLDRERFADICAFHPSDPRMPQGPFFCQNPLVVPASFGSIMEIYKCVPGNFEAGAVKELGPDVVVASLSLNIFLNVA